MNFTRGTKSEHTGGPNLMIYCHTDYCVLIKREVGGKMRKGVGVVRDKEIKMEDGETSHT